MSDTNTTEHTTEPTTEPTTDSAPGDAAGAKTALVTGANKGIGYAVAAGLGALGYRVGIGARDDARRTTAVEKLRAGGVDAFGVPLDVTDDRSVAEAADLVARVAGRLDALVNNAGISGEMAPGWYQDPTTLDLDLVREVVETNVLGVIRVTNAMLPLLRRAASPRIVNMSSSVASLTRQADPDIDVGPIMAAYAPSKTFLNGVTVQYARQFAGTNLLVNAACPGLVATDFTGFHGPRTPEQGAATAIRLATLPDGGPTGGFYEDAGVVPW
ncbi:SDR family oxidoreductase [Actinacidiphila sp. DG2A-62]|uniref:SDR family oxidoreductase n=1 Tax=Actinacidiphila sp. DG2A-62 TaxID=3108821 RepID=UPI002DB9633B|nr:SDR family oxidoreductase [Actinacidiphila sp. DG2A-62]MEC3996219.1 SDR family oxidoreductase [Actinacidiphila sp. DG2A-62]